MAGKKQESTEELPYSREQRGDPDTSTSTKDPICSPHPPPQLPPLISVISLEISFSTHLVYSAVPSEGIPKGKGQDGTSVPSGPTSAKSHITRGKQSSKARSFSIHCWSTILPKNPQCLRSELQFHMLISPFLQNMKYNSRYRSHTCGWGQGGPGNTHLLDWQHHGKCGPCFEKLYYPVETTQ